LVDKPCIDRMCDSPGSAQVLVSGEGELGGQ
jgi:hypothetical protein